MNRIRMRNPEVTRNIGGSYFYKEPWRRPFRNNSHRRKIENKEVKKQKPSSSGSGREGILAGNHTGEVVRTIEGFVIAWVKAGYSSTGNHGG